MSAMNGSLSASEAQSMAQYIHSFLDLVDNLPNEITRHLTQLHVLHNNYLKLMDRMNTNVDNYNQLLAKSSAIAQNDSNIKTTNKKTEDSLKGLAESQKRLTKKISIHLIQMQEISDEKLRYSQLIMDLIETKAKELDLDYEELIQFNGRIGSNSDISVNHKLSANTSNHSSNVNTFETKLDTKQRETTEDTNSRFNDKRLLPRRACAVKSGQTFDAKDMNEEMIDMNDTKVTQNKTIRSKTFSKSHGFGHSMSNFYRDMARRRAKLPKVSKMSKIAIKIKDNKTIDSMKRNAKKSNRKSMKATIAANSGAKQTNGSNNSLIQKRVNKSSIDYSSASSSSSLSCDNEEFDSNVFSKEKTNYRMNGKKESKKSSNHLLNTIKNKKNNLNHNSSTEELFIGEPIDPNEPTYCLCSQVSYGEMICCDNTLCPIEWFHFPCVDLVKGHKPKGKWFCPKCRKGDKHNVPKSKLNTN